MPAPTQVSEPRGEQVQGVKRIAQDIEFTESGQHGQCGRRHQKRNNSDAVIEHDQQAAPQTAWLPGDALRVFARGFPLRLQIPSAPNDPINYRRITATARAFSVGTGLSGTGTTGSVILVGL